MVLQRDKPNRLWGWTTPGDTVTVEIDRHQAKTTAGADGKWIVTVEVPPAGGPYRLKVSGSQDIELTDVLVGDVWLCGGQSNMEVPLRESAHGVEESRSANSPRLRFCVVPTRNTYLPAPVAQCTWSTCTPETAARFSAVAYYFARRLQADVQVPIGLIQDAVGGSPVEAWISAESLMRVGEFTPQLAGIRELSTRAGPQYGSFLMHWLDDYDIGGRGETWAKPDLDETGWTPAEVPNGFAGLSVSDAPVVCWFRRELIVPEVLPEGPIKIYLGEIEKMDTTYVNGRWIGASSWVENPRIYTVPAGTLKPGKNVIAVRVFRTKTNGGFRSSADTLRIQFADGASIPLAGRWQARVSVDARPPHPWPLDRENYSTMPTTLANGMLAPLGSLAITGALWYQGEANASRATQYRKLLPAMIRDWRTRFNQGDFPFYIVSLPAFMARRSETTGDDWSALRAAQAHTVATVPNTALVVTIDTGEADNIHPKDKKTVGDRLALRALAQHYHVPVVDSGPTFAAMEKLPGKLRLHFSNLAGGLVVRGEKLGEFSIAGADGKWRWAQAAIDGDDAVVVSSPEVPTPVAARYAWQGNPLATLFNKAGLPAAPFSTED